MRRYYVVTMAVLAGALFMAPALEAQVKDDAHPRG